MLPYRQWFCAVGTKITAADGSILITGNAPAPIRA
jgi:hypothetical protein